MFIWRCFVRARKKSAFVKMQMRTGLLDPKWRIKVLSYGLSVFSAAFVSTILVASVFTPVKQSQAESGTYDYSIVPVDDFSLSLSATAAVNLGLSVADSDAMTVSQGQVSVITNSAGYRLYISMIGDTTALNGIKEGLSGTIDAVSGTVTTPTTLSRGTWGYAIPSDTAHVVSSGFDSDYDPMESAVPDTTKKFAVPPISSNTPQMIASSSNATGSGGDSFPIYYGVVANADTAPGNYENGIIFTAVADAANTETMTLTPDYAGVDAEATIEVKTSLYTTAEYANADIYFLTPQQYSSIVGTNVEALGVDPLPCKKVSSVPVTYSCTFTTPAQKGVYYIYAKAPIYDKVYSATFDVDVLSTLTVNPAGGIWEGSAESQSFIQPEETTKTINNPTETPSYTIAYDGNSQGASYVAAPTSATRPFLSWTPSGGGTFENGVYTFDGVDGSLTATYDNTSITLPEITKTGHTCYWAEGSASGIRYDSGAENVPILINTTFYAVCMPKQYTITLNGNGATTAGSSSTTATYNATTLSAITNPQRSYTVSGFTTSTNNASGATVSSTTTLNANYTFNGWYKESGATNKIASNATTPVLQASTSFTDANGKWVNDGGTTLYAGWSSAAVTLPSISKEGHDCGWTTTSSGATTIAYQPSASLTPTGNTVLYGVCVVKQYTLTVNPNGGTWGGKTTSSTVTQNYGTTYALGSPSAGPTFTISYSDNSQGASYTGSPTSVQRPFTSWSKSSGSGSLSGSTWTFGAGNGAVQANYSGTSNSFSLPAISKTGHTCKWAEGSTSGTQYTGGTSRTITGNTTYFAVCSKTSYTVNISNSNTTSGSASISVPYGGSNTVTVTPSSGYILRSVSCPSGYTCTGYTVGISGSQTVTVTNNDTVGGGTLTFTGAIPFGGITQMQQMTSEICEDAVIGETAILTDTRDTNDYTVKVLKDGKCWMTQNLRLTGPKYITSSDSDVEYSFTLPAQNTGEWCMEDDEEYDHSCIETANNLSSGNDTYGTYYSWYAATAGSGNHWVTYGRASDSICPKGWRLPTGGSYGNFYILYSRYDSGADMINDGNFVSSGYRKGNSTLSQGKTGIYWSDYTGYDTNYAYVLWGTNPTSTSSRYYGATVRCVAE